MRHLPVTIFVVDDDPADAKKYAAILSDNIKQTARAFIIDQELQFDITVQPIYPESHELADHFERRFEDIVRLQDPSTRELSLRLQAVLFDLSFSISASQGKPPTSGERLAALTRKWRPNVTRFGLTSLKLAQRDKTPLDLLKVPFKKEQLDTDASATSVSRCILAELEARFATPTWDGLMQFAKLTKVPMHAMASTEARQAELSYVVDPFLRLLGSTYYQIEATSTKYPLDSLLSPTGAIKKSQEALALSFGATDAHIVTNGTSSANKIVYAALVEDGDYVLIDECCHISHHHAISLTGASAIYVQPSASGIPGVPGQVEVNSIVAALRGLLTNHPRERLPKLIAITNCTFDGFLVEPTAIFEGVLDLLNEFNAADRLGEITFLFDEAWFSFGYFHPEYVKYSAMAASRNLKLGENGEFWSRSLNVISTQSLHKTGFALRQAAIILKSIGTEAVGSDDALSHRFGSAVKMFSTTSPSMPIVASVDWARRQLDIEGCVLVDAALDAVEVFSRNFGALTRSDSVYLWDGECAGVAVPRDRTKVTMRSERISGIELRNKLWELSGVRVQSNKFAVDSVLLMFMPGFSDRSSALLRAAIDELLDKVEDRGTLSEPGNAPSLSRSRFLGADGEVTQYPEAFMRGDGMCLRRCVFDRRREAAQFVRLDESLLDAVRQGEGYASATYVTPYPPGFPVLVPSQVVTPEILQYLLTLEHGEVHGLTSTGGVSHAFLIHLNPADSRADR